MGQLTLLTISNSIPLIVSSTNLVEGGKNLTLTIYFDCQNEKLTVNPISYGVDENPIIFKG